MSSQHPHMPASGKHVPISTYRLQLSKDFTFQDAIAHLGYWQALGITDLFLSPILQAVPGSMHGYDVVDHHHISAELGGRSAFEDLADAAHRAGLSIIVDLVPNHMAVPTPVWINLPMWSVLKQGKESPYAHWFDIDIDQPILMPILGKRIGQVLADQEISLEQLVIPGEDNLGKQWVLRYFDHYFPVATGTEALPMEVLLERQHYRLAHWKVADEELNYRRFFDIDSLAALRVEERDVFDSTHSLLLQLFNAGFIDGFRVDHPDGLADPAGYFHWLSEATGGAWIAGEKILEDAERLPSDWPICGTTGYDTSWRLTALQVDSRASLPLGTLMQSITGDSPSSYRQIERQSKAQIIDTSLAAEVRRIGQLLWRICQNDFRLRDYTFRSLLDCLRELIMQMPAYRSYVTVGQPASNIPREIVQSAATRALRQLDSEHSDTMEVIVSLVLGDEIGSAALNISDRDRQEFLVRFQQVCGAVMAKGVEDTTFYRWTHLLCLNEVGSNPQAFGVSADNLHLFARDIQTNWPATMTTNSTHDTKRGEDVRMRLAIISQYPTLWAQIISNLRDVTQPYRPNDLDGRSENMLWQTLIGSWDEDGPISSSRLRQYLVKAIREQKSWTTWTNPDTVRENELLDFADQIICDPQVAEIVSRWHLETGEATGYTILANKALQLTMPGVADVYQGSEITQTSLVDPDNRRPVDFSALSKMLSHLDTKGLDFSDASSLDQSKLYLTAAILRLRRRLPDCFVSAYATYQPLALSTGYAVAFARGTAREGAQIVTIARRLPGVLARYQGDFRSEHTVVLPKGSWKDICSNEVFSAGMQSLEELLFKRGARILERVD